ncbi:MAG: S1 RNA-binding domain-containing protein [Candidatus Bipolaricaulota bacterium]|nr:S1 RNA-binding domain-containing protein [Candidatus Bipolaricaulota bacterium]MDW8126719.1 S1 RNA-binding domain-containing protein [Candidatus Bipolaricaulota bacterium]
MAEKYRVGELVWARVLETLPSGLVLGLDEETQGFLPASEVSAEGNEKGLQGFSTGMELLVKIVGYDRLGRPTLSLRRVTETDREEAEFHREALEFRSMLSNRTMSLSAESQTEERLEWRLAWWLTQAEGVLRRRQSDRSFPGLPEEKE